MAGAHAVVLRMVGVSKAYLGTQALKGVDFELKAGAVNVLVGENGAGKSTMMKIIAGVEQPTSGQLLLDGRPVSLRSCEEARRHGIGIVFQELNLFPNLSIAENLFIGRELVKARHAIDMPAQRERARALLRDLAHELDPDTLVGDLRVGQQQIVEIAKALAACDAVGVPLMVHENFRWQPPMQAARRVLDSGAIGTPFWGRFSFRSAFDVYRTQPYLAQGQRFIIEDLGIHVLDIARFLLGDVTTLNATTQRVNPRIAGEDVATVLMRHTSGAASVVDCSYASPRAEELFPQTLLEIDGSDGSLRVDAGYKLHVYSRSGVQSTQNCEPPLHAWAQRPWFNIQDSVLNIQAHWLDCLAQGRETQTSGRDNLKTLALVEAAYRSAGNAQQAIQL